MLFDVKFLLFPQSIINYFREVLNPNFFWFLLYKLGLGGGGGGGGDLQQVVAMEQQKLQFMSQVTFYPFIKDRGIFFGKNHNRRLPS